MKRTVTYLLLLLISAFALSAKTYSVHEIPNVHVADSTRFVSNPDGVLTPAGEQALNEELRALMRNTTAEFAVVAVNGLDSDIDEFATDLFRAWGLGKKDTNNGLLLLIATDSRDIVFRTGGGVEGLLPDGLLGSIIRKEMTPRFRDGDFDGGTLAAVNAVSTILSSPEGREEILSKYANNASSGKDFGDGLFTLYLILCGVITGVLLLLLIVVLAVTAKRDRYQRYQELNKIYPTVLFLTFLGLGMPLIVLIPLLIIRHRLRRGPHYCKQCGERMQLMDEVHDNDFLNHAQDLEEQIGSIDYDVWVCPKCTQTEIIPYIQRSSGYEECPVCHARTMRAVSDRIVTPATTEHAGTRIITYRCLNCGHNDDKYISLPRERPTPPVVIIPGAGFGGGSGGGIGGGSFGGGFTAGGGARGGW